MTYPDIIYFVIELEYVTFESFNPIQITFFILIVNVVCKYFVVTSQVHNVNI